MKETEENKAIMKMFSDGAGFGDPEARRNAELQLQVLLVQQQARTARNLNFLTLLLVAVGVINAVILAVQIWKN